jgi:hypothetical protein
MKMPKMEEGKHVKNGKWHLRQKCQKKISALFKTAKKRV